MPEQHEITVKVVNRLGLHARPAMELVDLAGSFKSDVSIVRDDQAVDRKSIMQVMMRAATKGTELTIVAEGPDAEKAVAAIGDLINRGFDEE